MGVESAYDGRTGRMSGREFRAFQDRRPDHERWELIGGVPMMMVPPTLAHNHIAENLLLLLRHALARHEPSRRATQRPGIELDLDDDKPEPDVAVLDAGYAPGHASSSASTFSPKWSPRRTMGACRGRIAPGST
jgi:Uma2 family endonuclease